MDKHDTTGWRWAGLLAALVVGCGGITVPPADSPKDTAEPPAPCTSDDDCAQADKPCLTGVCDTSSGTCTSLQAPDTCFIGGSCFNPGQEEPGNSCNLCAPSESTAAFTPVSCEGGQTCAPSTGECQSETPDTVTDVPDEGPGDAAIDIPTPVDGDPPPPDDGPDVPDPPDEGPDVPDPPDAGPDVVGPPQCQVNADCKGALEVGPCQAAVCIKSVGECTAITLDEGTNCTPAEAPDPSCWSGTCDAGGACIAEPLSNSSCDDEDLCTQSDVCAQGVCIGTPKACDDGDECSLDTCEPETGDCVSYPMVEGEPCEDGNPCTTGDACLAEGCVGGVNGCECTTDAECGDDADLCNGVLGCVAQPGGGKACEIAAGSAVECDTSGDDVCNKTACVPETGVCETVALVGVSCEDADACTFNDKCKPSGLCAGNPQDCDDKNICTDDSCAGGVCSNAPNGGSCNDGDPCTIGDGCSGEECTGEPKPCSDGNPCTNDYCGEDGQCVFDPLMGADCDDGDHCTAGDTCACPSGDCSEGVQCAGAPVDCDDANVCTDDSCPAQAPGGFDPGDPASACVHTPNSSPCSDGDACTAGDKCQSGGCEQGTAVNCEVSNPCKVGSCDPTQGCVVADADSGQPCDDGNPCTSDEACSGGACGGGTTICQCTSDVDCDNNDPCDGVETCETGAGGMKTCQSGTPVVCPPSNNPCQENACSQGICALQNIDEGKACGADTACESARVCTSGACVGKQVLCPTKLCMVNTGCDPTGGCTYDPSPAGTPCDDGSVCSVGESCSGGQCLGTALDCDDKNPCTSDLCSDKLGGCYQLDAKDGTTCDADGTACTIDWCQSGKCTNKLVQNCDDGIACTTDSCNPVTGNCAHTADDSQCDDKNACTTDSCGKGGCTHTSLPDFAPCDDGLATTGPDVCFADGCVGANVTSQQPPGKFLSCSPTSSWLVGVSTYNNAHYALGNYDRKTPGTSFGSCVEPTTHTAAVYSLTGTAQLSLLDAEWGVGRTIEGGVMVGDAGLVGAYDDGDWEIGVGALADTVAAQGGEYANFVGLSASGSGSLGSILAPNNYLLGGRTKGGFALLCTRTGGDWSCSAPTVSSNASSTLFDYRGTTLHSTSKCVGAPIAFCTFSLAGGWLASSSTDGYADLFQSVDGGKSFDTKGTTGLGGGTLTGALQQGADILWAYGTAGFLYRCEGGTCAPVKSIIDDQTGYDFVAADAYSGGIVFLAQSGAASALVVYDTSLPASSSKSYTAVELDTAGTVYDLEVSTTTGIYVVGATAGKVVQYRIWAFLK